MTRQVAWIKQCLTRAGATPLKGILRLRQGNFDHSVVLDITGIHTDGRRILARVTDLAGLKTTVVVGQTIAVPVDRFAAFTSQ